MSFKQFTLDPRIRAGVGHAGFVTPTPIQEQAIPPALEGKDIMGLAQTGTGKTAAFVLPILQKLLTGPRKRLRALIISPTRELAQQIHEHIGVLGTETGLRSATVYGGVGMNPQITAFRSGVEIIVACPGRLLDHMGQKTASLRGVEVLVIDEADRMFDMGFMPDVRRILRQVPPIRQTMLFSATMPDDIRKLADRILKHPTVVQIGSLMPVKTVTHSLYDCQRHLKTPLLVELLRRNETDGVLVFANTRHRVTKVAAELKREGFQATPLEGGMSQSKRQEALNGFRDGKYEVLVATDVAARGIDVERISHVVNYDIPENADAYTHRIGRTGRAQRTGEAITLVTLDDGPIVQTLEGAVDAELVLKTLEGFDYDAPAPPRQPGARRRPGGDARRRNGGSGGAGRPGRPGRSGGRGRRPAGASARG